ncbi:DUF2797 domain-containing protein [Desmospora activa]|uniref:Uncharacterized protein DUF2797 n=1 Tax=Desmospora activa DSM 45169 TaxID=1121389 RepID=A0A2T4Z6J1_9BACL|nr:DUF2797 domain-containing protein [Desmospora activa]PTM57509.1 uncharacterized protein DUF2797 [Desmospora activa DSM 45169]
MKLVGSLRALQHKPTAPVSYFFRLGDQVTPINDVVGKRIRIQYQGEIHCIHCGRKIKKTYNAGSCYPCFRALPENDLCIVKPQQCHYHQGTCRDNAFAEAHCLQPHIVYLALSSDVKVGITRKIRTIERWVDQGAVAALPIAEVPTRKDAGELEVHLSQYVSDKTNWRRMLKNEITYRNLTDVKEELHKYVPEKYQPYLLNDATVTHFAYPHISVPEKIAAWNLDKHAEVDGTLIGIKGQYLILDTGVLNVRKFCGYTVALMFE